LNRKASELRYAPVIFDAPRYNQASAEMSKSETLKPCDSCGVRVRAPNGHESSDGTFFCPACYSTPAARSLDAPRRCSVCDQVVARKDCHRDPDGKYVCQTCDKKRIRQTPRRRIVRGAGMIIRYALVAVVAILIVIAFLWLCVFVLERATAPPPLE
jgi:hypothetical protein